MGHEFQMHRAVEEWRCNLSEETFQSQDSFRIHIHQLHRERFAVYQSREVLATARRIVARNASLEECPFCLTAPAQTEKGFASHVGKHLQDISLAALPNLEMDSDQANSGDDSDGDEDDYKGSEGNDSLGTDTSSRMVKLRRSDDDSHGGQPIDANNLAESTYDRSHEKVSTIVVSGGVKLREVSCATF
jgi:hypothetical protein